MADASFTDIYSSDAPLSDPTLDKFRRFPFAQRIAQTVAQRQDPSSIVIGIYGPWGDGKSTVLNFIAQEFDQHSHIVTVRFNPWLFRDESSLLKSFFVTLAEALNRSLSTKREQLGEWLENYGSIVSALSLSLGGVIQLPPDKLLRRLVATCPP